jgi:DNA (cytosine-5)-methyltransferase 3A
MGINVLSLFDGMSCGQIALERTGIKVDNYFASEIDKYGQIVSKANYPNTIYLGDVRHINAKDLPKIDLIIGGSPCQSFSFAGKRKGMSTKDEQEILTLQHYLQLKSEGFEFEGQSYLFWEYMRLLNECNPEYFLLENVEMGEKWEKVLSKAIGVNGIHINSALVSAQNRKRIYWTNIGMKPSGLFGDLQTIIEQPKDKGILLKDVLQCQVDEKYYLKQSSINKLKIFNERQLKNGTGFSAKFRNPEIIEKMDCLKIGGGMKDDLIVHNMMPRSSTSGKGSTGHLTRNDGKTYCLDTGNTNAVEIVAMRGRANQNGINIQQLEHRDDNKTNCLTSVQKDNLVKIIEKYPKLVENKGNTNLLFHRKGFKDNSQVYGLNGKCGTLDTAQGGGREKHTLIESKIRRLTPLECERLQTVPDNYTNHVSDSQRYKMLGNGWTVDVISHIFKYL